MEPLLIDETIRSGFVFTSKILDTYSHHLIGRVLQKFGQTIGKNSQEILLRHVCELLVGDHSCEGVF